MKLNSFETNCSWFIDIMEIISNRTYKGKKITDSGAIEALDYIDNFFKSRWPVEEIIEMD